MDKGEMIAELIERDDFWNAVFTTDFLVKNDLAEFPVGSDSTGNSGPNVIPVSSTAIPPWDWPYYPPEKPQDADTEPSINPVGPSTHEIITGLRETLNRVSSLMVGGTPVSDINQAVVMAHFWLDALTMKVFRNEI